MSIIKVDTVDSRSGGKIIFNKSISIPDAVNVDEPLTKGQLLTEIKAVDGVGSGLDADLVQGIPKDLLGIGGDGYTWVDETANRAKGVTYTNTAGKPILLSIAVLATTNTGFTLSVDGIIVYNSTTYTDFRTNLVCIVPNGSTYTISDSTYNIEQWYELK